MEYRISDADLTNLLNSEDANFTAHRTSCILTCESLASRVQEVLEETTSDFGFNRHVLTFSSGKSAAHGILPDVHLVIYLEDKAAGKGPKSKDVEVQLLKEEMTQVLHGIVSKVEGVKDCTFSGSAGVINASIDGLKVVVQPAMYLDALEFSGDEVTNLWVNTLEYPLKDEETIEFVARSGALKLAEYLRWQPMFVRKVVMLMKLWAVTNVAGAGRGGTATASTLLNALVELVAIKCSLDEVRRAREMDEKPKMSKALGQCWVEFCSDFEEVQFWFDDVKFPIGSAAVEKLERAKNYGYSMLLDPINPYLNYLAEPNASEPWTMLLRMAERTMEFLESGLGAGKAEVIKVVFGGVLEVEDGEKTELEVEVSERAGAQAEVEDGEKTELGVEVGERVGAQAEVEDGEKTEVEVGERVGVQADEDGEKQGAEVQVQAQGWRRIVEADPLVYYGWKLIKYFVYYVGGYIIFLILAFYALVFYVKYFVAL